MSSDVTYERWGAAMDRALYGPDGFYTARRGAPGRDFRTSSTASPHFARALLRLALHVDAALDFPDPFTLVEVAAAGGALLTALRDAAAGTHLAPRLRLVGVDLAGRPDGLPDDVTWHDDIADVRLVTGLLVANEWLDNVPCDVVEQAEAYAAYVEVAPDGTERLAERVEPADQHWLDLWWPLVDEGERAEVGRHRDAAWYAAVAKLDRGVALAVDYAHDLADREAGLVAGGTLTGFREGRQVRPVPDGSCDLTAHVALDAVAAAGTAAGATDTVRIDQRTALKNLGVQGARPPLDLASSDPAAYLRALGAASDEAELIARGGLGEFGWLAQAVGMRVPDVLR